MILALLLQAITLLGGYPAPLPNSFGWSAPQSSPTTYSGCTVSISNGMVTITCPVAQPPLTIVTPVALPHAIVGQPYSANLAELVAPSGGVAPYTFKPVDGFPAWSRLSTAGMLTGTPVAPCSCILKFTVSDSSGQTIPVSSDTPAKGVPLNVQDRSSLANATFTPSR